MPNRTVSVPDWCAVAAAVLACPAAAGVAHGWAFVLRLTESRGGCAAASGVVRPRARRIAESSAAAAAAAAAVRRWAAV